MKKDTAMQRSHREEKLYFANFNAKTREGYLRHMLSYDFIPQGGKILAIAYGHRGKLRINNALGCMVPIEEVASVKEMQQPAVGEYSMVAVYYVVEHLAAEELALFFQHIKKLLLPTGGIMVVLDWQGKHGHDCIKNFRQSCRRQGLTVERTILWRRQPINSWDHSTDAGKTLSPLVAHLPLLRSISACSASFLLSI